jgi:cation transport protein ChaC
MAEHWVFGYGSLMWRPQFSYLEAKPALLVGAHRALCVASVVHRGSRRRPGLVLGLDVGGRCEGIAFRLAAGDARHIRNELKKREQVTLVYREAMRSVQLLDGSSRSVRALCFLTDRNHPQYAGALPLYRQAWMVRAAVGRSGRNADYVLSTLEHMEEADVADQKLAKLVNIFCPCRLPRSPDFSSRTTRRQRSYGVLKPVPRPVGRTAG